MSQVTLTGGGLTSPTAASSSVVEDSFTGADNASSLIGRTTEVGAKTWTRASGTGTYGISSNKAYKSDANTTTPGVYVDSGVADCTITCDFTTGATVINERGLLLRFTDTSNYMRLICNPGSPGWYIQKFIAGVSTNVANGGTAAANTTYALTVILNGSSVVVKVDGVQVISTTVGDASVVTATKHGLLDMGNGAHLDYRWDNFIIV